MSRIDARVDHRDRGRRQGRQLGPGVVGAILREVPLLRRERIVGHEGDAAHGHALDVADPVESGEGRGAAIDDERRHRREALNGAPGPALELGRQRRKVRARRTPIA